MVHPERGKMASRLPAPKGIYGRIAAGLSGTSYLQAEMGLAARRAWAQLQPIDLAGSYKLPFHWADAVKLSSFDIAIMQDGALVSREGILLKFNVHLGNLWLG